jgi:hypothetical protein
LGTTICSLFYSSYGNNTFVAVASTGTGNDNLLTWQTASEVNNSHFDIERSTNGSTFHSIGQVKGNNKPSRYQYVDENPLWEAGGLYYRLKQVDFDGTETYSKIVSVSQKDTGKGLKVYPTLGSNGILSIESPLLELETVDIQVFNLTGQQVLNAKTLPPGVGGLDVSALPQGT